MGHMTGMAGSRASGGGGGAPSGLDIEYIAGAEHEAATSESFTFSTGSSIVSGVTDAHGRVYQVTSGGSPRKNFIAVATPTSLSVRLRVRPTILATGRIIGFLTSANTPQCGVRFIDDGAFEVVSSSSTLIQKSATGLWSIDNWYDLEFLALVSDTGSYTAKLWNNSGTLLETLTGSADTKGSGTNDVDRIELGNTANDPYIDNLNIDLAGNLLGRCRVITRYPTGNGDLVQWTRGGTDTGNNYDQVDEAVKDTTSYVQSTAADEYEFYTVDLTSLGGTMKALQAVAMARAATAGTQQFKLVLRIAGVTYEGAITHSATATGADIKFHEVWNNNPATGNAWDGTETVQIGFKSVTGNVRGHQACAEVLVAL